MPSSTKKQAHFMSAIAHGWKPDHPRHKMPSRAVAEEFHEADKSEGKWEHASGGPAGMSPLESTIGGGGFGEGLGFHPHMGSSMYVGKAPMRMPRVPIADTMRNIDQHIKGASVKLPKIGQKLQSLPKQPPMPHHKFAGGGQVNPQLAQVIQQALNSIKSKDLSTAGAMLRGSPIAMQHPVTRAASTALRNAQHVDAAIKALQMLAQHAPSTTGQSSGGIPPTASGS